MTRIFRSARFWMLVAVVGCGLWGFMGMFGRVSEVFGDKIEDLSHGWLVLPFSLYVLWTERAELKRAVGAPSWAGLLACIPCLVLALLGTRGLQVRFEQVGFIGLCVAVPWAFFGRRLAQLFVFPALFLLFTIPLSTFLDVVTIHLRLLASGIALGVLKGFGVDAIQRGTAILSQGAHPFSIDVAEPCSGLRSLFALMALTAAYAWFTQPTWLRRGALFVCSVPLAIAGNVTRILSICLVAAWGNADFATGFYHDYSGYIVFVVAIALMVACGEVVTRVAERGGKAAEGERRSENGGSAVGEKAFPGACAVPGLATALLCAAFVFQGMTTEPALMEPPVVVLPQRLPGTVAEEVFFCQNEQCAAMLPRARLSLGATACPICGSGLKECSVAEATVLPSDTRIFKRLYHAGRGVEFLVTAVVGGRTKSSLHRPEVCMPAQGFSMLMSGNVEMGGRPFHLLRLMPKHGHPFTLAYTFFNQAGTRTSRHMQRIVTDIWDRAVHNRIDRWVMVTVAATAPQGEDGFSTEHAPDRAALESFLSRLSEALP